MFNTIDRFGLVAIILHWVIALTIFGLFVVGWYMIDLTYYDKLKYTLPAFHKSIGMLLILVFGFWVIWKLINLTPEPVEGSTRFEIIASKLAHLGLAGLIAIILLTGYLIPTAKGMGISVFGWFEVPATITSIPQQEDITGLIHKYLAYTIIGLALLHAAAALKHHFINKDDTLRRMLGRVSRNK
ncbi:MAG: cytochrome b [Gammaproteobacteria bacterium]|nr:cytochrome b [Gammaproteobacteria bacterium]